MPELPEIETVRRQAQEHLVGLTIENITVNAPKMFVGSREDLVGATITGTRRFAKILVLDLDNGKSIAIHFKMSGRLIYDQGDRGNKGDKGDWETNYKTSPHTHIVFSFTNCSKLYYWDLRMFGWLKIVQSSKCKVQSFFGHGPEFLSNLTMKQFRQILKTSNRPIKVVLMDQEKMSGVGNIYANDGLFCAGIDPRRKAKDLSETEANKLFTCLEHVLREGLKYGGASENQFRDLFGAKGTLQEHFLVYSREGEPCLNGNGLIRKFMLAGRGTYYCPACQK